MNDLYFDNVTSIGKLYLEHVFYEFEAEPILFSCVDEMKKLYLCLCTEIRFQQKWIIAQCGVSTLKALIDEDIDIASAFLITPEFVIVTMDLQGKESSGVINRNQIDRLDLPKEGTYIKCDKGKAKDYLWNKEVEILSLQLKSVIDVTPINEMTKSYSGVFSKKISIFSKQEEMYCNASSKEFVGSFERLPNMEEQSMTIEYQYSVYEKDKYVEIIDSMCSIADDNYLRAA